MFTRVRQSKSYAEAGPEGFAHATCLIASSLGGERSTFGARPRAHEMVRACKTSCRLNRTASGDHLLPRSEELTIAD